MTTTFKKERLEMMKDLYEGNGSIEYLLRKFGLKRYNDIIEFLILEKLIIDKERTLVITVSWKLSTKGIKIYEKELEREKIGHSVSIGNISNSNVSVNSSNIRQMIKNETDEDLKLKLGELEKAIKEKDGSKIIKIMQYISDKSVDLLINIIAGSLKV
jgi:hypothetical protein